MDARKFPSASQARAQRGLTTVDIDLSQVCPSAGQVLPYPGTLLYIDKASTGVISVEGSTDQGVLISPLVASPGFSMYNEAGFSGFRVSWVTQTNKIARLVIASGMQIKPGDPVTSGSIATQTVDAGLVRTLNGQAFLNSGQQGAVAAQYAYSQIWNPPGSGKLVQLEAVSFSTTNPQTIQLGYFSATFGGGVAGVSKYLAGAAGKGLRQLTTSASTLLTSQMLAYIMAASQVQTINFREPVVIPEGKGFGAATTALNTDLSVNYEYYE